MRVVARGRLRFPDLGHVADRGWSSITIEDVLVSQAGLPANLTRADTPAAWRKPR